jgi:hypothetical protein
MDIATGGTNVAHFNNTTTNNETAMMLLTRIGGVSTVKRVELGAADSGGAGYRMLRVLN